MIPLLLFWAIAATVAFALIRFLCGRARGGGFGALLQHDAADYAESDSALDHFLATVGWRTLIIAIATLSIAWGMWGEYRDVHSRVSLTIARAHAIDSALGMYAIAHGLAKGVAVRHDQLVQYSSPKERLTSEIRDAFGNEYGPLIVGAKTTIHPKSKDAAYWFVLPTSSHWEGR